MCGRLKRSTNIRPPRLWTTTEFLPLFNGGLVGGLAADEQDPIRRSIGSNLDT
jgi:hypothetical protein